MPTNNSRIREQLAKRVLELARGDVALAVKIMTEFGLGEAEAFAAIDEVLPLECTDPVDRPLKDSEPL